MKTWAKEEARVRLERGADDKEVEFGTHYSGASLYQYAKAEIGEPPALADEEEEEEE